MLFILIILAIICFTIPPLLTILNIKNLFSKNPTKELEIDLCIMLIGLCEFMMIFSTMGPDFKKATEVGVSHEFISTKYSFTIYILILLSILSFVVLRIKKTNLAPLIIVFLMSLINIGLPLFIALIIQTTIIHIDFISFYMIMFVINYFICTTRLYKQIINEYRSENENNFYNNKLLIILSKILRNSKNWSFLSLLISIPVLITIILILTLFGQQIDSIIKAFTETSDWKFSQEISPPSYEPNGHYLCTVALIGHKNIVKPIRMGIRGRKKIPVNRQLCIANAFEQIIEERMPSLHKFIRKNYDKYGYPLSKHITTPFRGDLIYLIMKPLEWFFLIILYCVEKKPENKISSQYLQNNFFK